MSNNIKQTIKREYLNCVQNPVHFMKKYCRIQHPTKGKIKFDLYDFQENMLTDFKEYQYNIILKSRQLGISTLSAGYSLWLMLFHQDKNILVIATKQDVAKKISKNIREQIKKINVSINGETLRFSSKSKNDLQVAIKLVSQLEESLNIPLKANNFR